MVANPCCGSIARDVAATIAGRDDVAVELAAPRNWHVSRLAPGRFRLFCPGLVADRNVLTVTLPGGVSVGFTMLGPAKAQGFPAGDNVPKCPSCHARIEACICRA